MDAETSLFSTQGHDALANRSLMHTHMLTPDVFKDTDQSEKAAPNEEPRVITKTPEACSGLFTRQTTWALLIRVIYNSTDIQVWLHVSSIVMGVVIIGANQWIRE